VAFTDCSSKQEKAAGQQKIVNDVEYEKKHKTLRLTFGRSPKGIMELSGINQTELRVAAK
jgi:hypothetical protein